jgi:hypothetical protein
MRKAFRGKMCAYCAVSEAATDDHVLAKEFVAIGQRGNLPIVPACVPCNRRKNRLETDLMAVLPFGAVHAGAGDNLETLVAPRLRKNERVRRELAEGAAPIARLRADWTAVLTTSLPVNGEKLIELTGLIARGLAWYHWPEELSDDHGAKAWSMTAAGAPVFERFLSLNSGQRVSAELGGGVLAYEGARGKDAFHLSVWRLRWLGGMTLIGDSQDPREEITHFGAVVGNRDFLDRFDLPERI